VREHQALVDIARISLLQQRIDGRVSLPSMALIGAS